MNYGRGAMGITCLRGALAIAACSSILWAAPLNARYLQVDPIGYDDQVNLYAYVGNDPLNVIDPTGEDRVTCNVTVGREGDFSARCTLSPDDSDSTRVTYNVTQHNRDGSTNVYTDRETFGGSVSREGIASSLANRLPFYESAAQLIRNNVDRYLSDRAGRDVTVMRGQGTPVSGPADMAAHGGRPRSNIPQNRQITDAANAEGLNEEQRRQLGRAVERVSRREGANLGYHDIREIARAIKNRNY